MEVQTVIWAAGGIAIIALVIADLYQRRDVIAGLLFCWAMGVFVFAVFLNWTVNARSLLPMAPVAGILLARRLDKTAFSPQKMAAIVPSCLAAGSVLALLVAHSDFMLAVAARESAEKTMATYGPQNGRIWFSGHWGFQFYMEQLGAIEVDFKHSPLRAGDVIALPLNNDSSLSLDPGGVILLAPVFVSQGNMVTTMNRQAGAGFYAASFAPLPFSFGDIPPEKISIYEIMPRVPAASDPKK